ncbi:MAG: hypothetical protein HQK53_14765 [Oligoflexia bacterium]|nr:hypothetical protein [Oligoflexia bacterium]
MKQFMKQLLLCVLLATVLGIESMIFAEAAAASAAAASAAAAGSVESQAIRSQSALNELVLQEFRKVVSDYETRVAVAKIAVARGELAPLNGGYWYTTDYFKLLSIAAESGVGQSQMATQRLEFFKRKLVFLMGSAPRKYFNFFDTYEDFRAKRTLTYILKEGVMPAEALEAIKGGALIFIDCGIAIQISYYSALKEMWGQELFNRYFLKKRMVLSFDLHQTPLFQLTDRREIEDASCRDCRPGEWVGFRNHSSYFDKEMNGCAGAFNVIVSESPSGEEDSSKFIGLGLPVRGITTSQMYQELVDGFNAEPFNDRIVLDDVWTERQCYGLQYLIAKYEINRNLTISIEDLLQDGGGLVPRAGARYLNWVLIKSIGNVGSKV